MTGAIIEIDPNNLDAYFKEHTYSVKGEYKKSLNDFNKIIDEDPLLKVCFTEGKYIKEIKNTMML